MCECVSVRVCVCVCVCSKTRPPDPINNVCSLSNLQISRNSFTYYSVQIFKSCAEDQMIQDLILRTRLCGIGYIAQHG